ncbi:hypothetical protein HDA40_007140 [Hamadaea flava]|uniref:Uncharacterized protein n=1 Tax=Hamadaea flava TaxID=1742688 RepID=A0ABV8LR10_9ACTN|nr:hypothetical protein [Hamadaea flava]MCP2328633.1 hypothetical protein [Hamadaea flava]
MTSAEPDLEPDFEPDLEPAGGAPGATGHRAVDAALRSLQNAAELPVGEQIAAYEAAHRTLRETLSTIDDA